MVPAPFPLVLAMGAPPRKPRSPSIPLHLWAGGWRCVVEGQGASVNQGLLKVEALPWAGVGWDSGFPCLWARTLASPASGYEQGVLKSRA